MINPEIMKLFILAMGVRASSPPRRRPAKVMAQTETLDDAPDPGDGLMPWQRDASERASRAYAAAQTKKWRRWNERMFTTRT